jgi:WD40 repeat protein
MSPSLRCPVCSTLVIAGDGQHTCPTCSSSFSLHAGPASTVASSADLAIPTDELPPPLPSLPPGYDYEGELGHGGMGVVYKVRDRALGRTCALKMILAASHASDGERQRFRTEAQAVARLNHPNVVQIFEVNTFRGLPFMALEFCPGGSLHQKLAAGVLLPRDAAELVRHLAAAVQAAHGANILHRDLKPANVLLGADGSPRITDFGLAKILEASPGPEAGGALTQTGDVMGTPSYMPPEQARGDKELGPGVDIYALGAILYECLTGRPPFRAATRVETLIQVALQEPVPLRQLNPAIPGDLETICHKCLQKDPARRYRSAQELADDLQRFLEGRPILARPVGPFERSVRWVRRNPVVATLATAIALVLVTGIAVASYFAVAASREAELKDREAKTAREAESKALLAEGKARKAEGEAKTNETKAITEANRANAEAYRANLSYHAIVLDGALGAWRQNDMPRMWQALAEVPPIFEGNWETRQVRDLARRTLRSFTGHESQVGSVCWSRDGSLLLGGGDDKVLTLWDVESGAVRRTFKGPGRFGASPTCACFSPDDRVILAGDNRGGLVLWDALTGTEKWRQADYPAPIVGLAFHPDGQQFLTAGADGSARLHTLDGKLERTFAGQGAGAIRACFSPDGKTIVTAGIDGKLILRDKTGMGDGERTLAGEHSNPVVSLAFSPDGKTVASGEEDTLLKVRDPGDPTAKEKDSDGRIILWDVATGRKKHRLAGHRYGTRSVAFSDDGTLLASGGGNLDRTLRIWDVTTGKERHALKVGSGIESVRFRPGTHAVAAAGLLNPLLWNPAALPEKWQLRKPGAERFNGVTSVRYSPDGKMLLSGGGDGILTLWESTTGREIRALTGSRGVVCDACFSPDGLTVLSGSNDGVLRLWDTATGEPKPAPKRDRASITALCFSPDGKGLLVADAGKRLRLLDRVTGQELVEFDCDEHRVSCVCFSPDGTLVCAGGRRIGSGGEVLLWDVTGKAKAPVGRTRTDVAGITFSRDGTTLLVGDQSGPLTLWDVATGKPKLVIDRRTAPNRAVALSPDNATILSANTGQIKLRDVRTGLEKLTLPVAGSVAAVSFSPEGRYIAAGGSDGFVRVWDAPPADDKVTR